jgi:hypothetical protein
MANDVFKTTALQNVITASNLEPRHWILDGDLSPLRGSRQGQDSFSRDASKRL